MGLRWEYTEAYSTAACVFTLNERSLLCLLILLKSLLTN